jgi:hypothetical protein
LAYGFFDGFNSHRVTGCELFQRIAGRHQVQRTGCLNSCIFECWPPILCSSARRSVCISTSTVMVFPLISDGVARSSVQMWGHFSWQSQRAATNRLLTCLDVTTVNRPGKAPAPGRAYPPVQWRRR